MAIIRLGSRGTPPGAGRGGGEGVRTRDHLSNTRTFLAWMRAAMALLTIGYVIDKFDLIVHVLQQRSVVTAHPADRFVALAVVVIALGLALFAFRRFRIANRMIDTALFRPRPLLDLPLLVLAGVGGVIILGYLSANGG